jgi:hypothetical protein
MKGRCVICDDVGRLTFDHVPPRSVSPPTALEVRRLADTIRPGPESRPAREAFQAASFPSLCRKCNNDRLGSKYDPVLASLVTAVRRWIAVAVDHGRWVPGDIGVTTQPFGLARSIVGHLLAAEERRDRSRTPPRGTFTNALREFFLADNAAWPDDLHLYTWLHPALVQVIVRGFAISGVIGIRYGPVVGDLLKFFPLAFWVTCTPASGVPYRLTEVPLLRSTATDPSITLTLPLRGQPPPTWPEQPEDGAIVFQADERTSIASPKQGRKSRRG